MTWKIVVLLLVTFLLTARDDNFQLIRSSQELEVYRFQDSNKTCYVVKYRIFNADISCIRD